MNKIFTPALVALIALGANVAAAQSYYPSSSYAPSSAGGYGWGQQSYGGTQYNYNTYGTSYAGTCVNLVADLSYGSRGSQVSQLQTFLVSQNFPGGGSWMITGNFRSATLAAVRNFQQQQGLPLSGIVDAATRAAIYRVSCGGGVLPSYSTYPSYPTYPTYPTPPTYPSNNNCSTYSHQYPYNNCCPSVQNHIPYVHGLGYVFGSPYQSQYQHGYNNYCPPTITSVNGPTSLSRGVQGTWTISVNNPSNSYMTTSVRWGDEDLYPSYSTSPAQTTYVQGTNTLTFTHTYQQARTYTIVFTVSNTSGQTNTSSATVNVTGGGSYGTPALSSISPMSGRVGTQIILIGSGFTPFDNTVHFGIGGMQHVPSQNGTTIYYTVPAFVAPCDLVTPGSFCTQNIQHVLPGPIQVYVTNSNGTTNTILFQVL